MSWDKISPFSWKCSLIPTIENIGFFQGVGYGVGRVAMNITAIFTFQNAL